MSTDTKDPGPSEVLLLAESVYACNEVACTGRLSLATIGRLRKEIYACPECKTLFLRPWSMEPYFDAVPVNEASAKASMK
jgi:hypothetical protein